MRNLKRLLGSTLVAAVAIWLLPLPYVPANANEMMMFEDFQDNPGSRWRFVADTVMGGVSDGSVAFEQDGDEAYVRLTGTVSTDNNGGFIQVRTRFDGGLAKNAQALRLLVRGNGERYYVFLRSINGTRPWHSYRHSFTAPSDWTEVRLPIADFTPSHEPLPERIAPQEVKGIGLVAYGDDFTADLSVASIAVE
jgi:hypothetical protein